MFKQIIYGRIIFAIGIAALAVLSIVSKDFIFGRPPAINTNEILSYALSIIILISAVIVIVNNNLSGIASFTIALLILIFSFLIRNVPSLIKAPNFEAVLWSINAWKTLAFFGGGLIVSASFFQQSENQIPQNFKKYNTVSLFITIGIFTLALFFIISGFAHFKFLDFVTNFIPSYIPLRSFFAQFTGVCLIAGGVGILIIQTRKWAALLAAIMLSGWFILLHIPRFIVNASDASDRMGLAESFAFAGIFFVLAGILEKRQK